MHGVQISVSETVVLRKCTKCKAEKPLSGFGHSKYQAEGLKTQCKDCEREYFRNYRKTNREQCNKWQRDLRKANPKNARAAEARYRARNPDKIKARDEKRYAVRGDRMKETDMERHALQKTHFPYVHRARQVISNMKRRSARLGFEFDEEAVTVGWLIGRMKETASCECCETVLDYHRFAGRTKFNETQNLPSFDRVDNKRGYERDNIAILCYRCNFIKSDAASEELITVGAWLQRKERGWE